MILEPDTLKKIAGGRPNTDNINSICVSVNRYGTQMGLNKAHRLAQFICQIAHESGRFRYDEEVWGPTPAQRRYEDRSDLGHSKAIPNEAFTFRGRTGMQVTGRYNYKRFTTWCRKFIDANCPDFERNPDLINTDPWEGLAPIWYWDAGNPESKTLNRYADTNNIEAITRKINGGLNGYDDRLVLYTRTALVFMGYEMAQGVVLRFQKDIGFTGDDLDDIAGIKTRGAMHSVLMNMAPLDKEEEDEVVIPDPVIDLTPNIEAVRELLQESGVLMERADRQLEDLVKRN